VVQLALTTYYSTVITNKPFLRDFLEILAILLGATVALYAFGYVIGKQMNLRVG
jgi:VIT1/CCC1 family predicted Fe2+/Mn2+ transporter